MRRTEAMLWLAVLLASCGESEPAVQQTPSDAGGPDATQPGGATSVSFDSIGTLTLLPGETREVSVAVMPPGEHMVGFALLGASLDASLDADSMLTAEDGRASVWLTASRAATTFRLRATADDGPFAELAISVSANGFATVVVTPAGYGGRRATPQWTASAVARTACDALPGIPPADGPIAADAPDGTAVVLEGLPVGPSLAITLRAGRSVSGCGDVKDLAAQEVRQVAVPVADTPIDVSATNVGFRMRVSAPSDEFRTALMVDADAFVQSIFPESESVAAALLDEMEAQAAEPAELSAARANGDWDQSIGTMLDAQGVDVRESVKGWIVAGLAPLWGGILLEGTLAAAGSGGAHAIVVPSAFGELPAASTSVPEQFLVTMQVGASDSVHVGGTVSWFPSRLVASGADEGARTQVPSAAGATEALQGIFQCAELAEQLESTAPLPSSCGSDCVAELCGNAIAAMMLRAAGQSEAELTTASIAFTVSAAADVTPDATIASFDGAWAGTYASGAQSSALKGTATAQSP